MPGTHEDATNRTKVEELTRCTSKSWDEQRKLKEYVDRMTDSQKDLHYITGESI